MLIKDNVLGKVLVALSLLCEEVLGVLLDLLERLAGPSGPLVFHELKKFLRKEPCWQPHIIDLDREPHTPFGYMIESHRKGGKFEWDPDNVQLFLTKTQKFCQDRGIIHLFRDLSEELSNYDSVFNATLLDYLLANPFLIPQDWKLLKDGKPQIIFFRGTIYRTPSGKLCTRCLYFLGDSARTDIGDDTNGPSVRRIA